MADGFLAPTGRFYPKTENFHAQTARAILGPEGLSLDNHWLEEVLMI